MQRGKQASSSSSDQRIGSENQRPQSKERAEDTAVEILEPAEGVSEGEFQSFAFQRFTRLFHSFRTHHDALLDLLLCAPFFRTRGTSRLYSLTALESPPLCETSIPLATEELARSISYFYK